MSNSKRPKAFFLNGGMGRIISAIPALEKYYESKEANQDSKSDAKVVLFLIIVAVIAATYWVAVQ